MTSTPNAGSRQSAPPFPVGYHPYHQLPMLNFQLNRWHSLGYARDQDMREAGSQLGGFADWQPVMRRLGESALNDGRVLNAAFYYRAAEFLVPPGDPEKRPLYDRFVELFDRATADAGLEQLEIPYEGSSLPGAGSSCVDRQDSRRPGRLHMAL